MFYKQVFAAFLCAAFLFPQSFAQTQTASKGALVAPELKEKTVALLHQLTREAEQFYLPENRVNARVLTANLLWEHDEKQARAAFQAAISELNALVGQIRLDDADETENAEEFYLTLEAVRALRTQLLEALAARDPKFALDALAALTRRGEDGETIFADDGVLELSLAEKIAEKDPKQAYEMARKNLEKNLGANLYTALESIYGKDAELGARLAREVLGKIKSRDTKIVSNGDYMTNSMSNGAMSNGGAMANGGAMMSGSMSNTATVQAATFTVNVWEIQQFLQSAKKLNRQAVKDKKTPVLTDAEMRELVDVMAQKYVKQQYLSPYEVAPMMSDIAKYFPAAALAIRRKMAQSPELEAQIGAAELQSETEDKTAEEIFQIAEQKPVAERDKFYRQAAEKAFEDGDVVKAKDYYGRVKKREEFDYFSTKLEENLPLALAKNGDLRAVRQAVAKLKTPEERIEILSTLAQSIAQNGDKKTALTLVNEARAQYSGRMKQRKNLNSVLQLAHGYAVAEPEQGFVLLESNVSYFNDLIAAGILIGDFNAYNSVRSDEVDLDTVRSESYRSAPGGVAIIRKLAAADFERATALAERFARPETKFFARFRIVEALLDPSAEETEKQLQQSEEYEGH